MTEKHLPQVYTILKIHCQLSYHDQHSRSLYQNIRHGKLMILHAFPQHA